MTTSETQLSILFLEFSRKKLLDQYWPRMRACVASLTAEQIWGRPNDACNSIGNLLLHLNGNVTQWMIGSFNRLEDHRDRPVEFSQREPIAGSVLLEQLDATMQEAAKVLARLTPEDLAATYHIQGYTVHGMDAVYQVVEHFGMHYGQVLYIHKMLCGGDLGFNRELNATGRAS